MEYDLNTLVMDFNGLPVKGEEGKAQTVKDFCVLSLLSVPSSANAELKEKVKRAVLADRLMRAESPMNLSPENVVTLKTVVGEGCMPWVVMQVLKVIDPTALKDD